MLPECNICEIAKLYQFNDGLNTEKIGMLRQARPASEYASNGPIRSLANRACIYIIPNRSRNSERVESGSRARSANQAVQFLSNH